MLARAAALVMDPRADLLGDRGEGQESAHPRGFVTAP
jgi:hypothetical protein